MIDWKGIEVRMLDKCRSRMLATPQPPQWHAEGDVLTHTMMVLEALESMPEYAQLPAHQQDILHMAAAMHDIGKVAVTKLIMGQIEAPHHAPIGSRMTRQSLWIEHGLCGNKEAQLARETVCELIRCHSLPPHIINSADAARQLHRIASAGLILPDFSVKLLCLLAKADMLGRKCPDQAEMLDNIALCEELAKEEGCYEACYPFPSAYTRRAYLSGRDVWKDQTLHDDTWGEAIIMCGLPGVGKDTWIKANCPDIPMISLDEIRMELKVLPTDNQGAVANLAHDRAKECLRRRQPFVWNATSITPQIREGLVSLFETYRASVRIVYLETDWRTELRQNRDRQAVVPKDVITHMLGKLFPPLPYEAARVDWL